MSPEKIKELHALFSRTEKRLKKMEYDGEGLDIPAINELRYVAFHLIKSLMGEQEQEAELEKAMNHARRAFYDASEACIVLHLSKIKEFEDKYQIAISISDVIKDYSAHRVKAERARKFLQDGDRQEKLSFYEDAEEHLLALEGLVELLFALQGELDAKVREQGRVVRRWSIGVLIGMLAAIVAAVVKFFS